MRKRINKVGSGSPELQYKIWVFPKNSGTPNMDGENNGKPLFHYIMDDLGGKPAIFGNTHIGVMLRGKT